MEQQENSQGGADQAAAPGPNAVPDLTAPPDLMNPLNPDAFMMSGQPFMPDPSMGGIPMADPSLMMPIMLANGNMPAQQQANGISAGQFSLLSASLRSRN